MECAAPVLLDAKAAMHLNVSIATVMLLFSTMVNAYLLVHQGLFNKEIVVSHRARLEAFQMAKYAKIVLLDAKAAMHLNVSIATVMLLFSTMVNAFLLVQQGLFNKGIAVLYPVRLEAFQMAKYAKTVLPDVKDVMHLNVSIVIVMLLFSTMVNVFHRVQKVQNFKTINV